MLNAHDSLDPRLYPQYRDFPGRYPRLAAEGAEDLRQAEGFEPLIIAMPEAPNATLAAGASYEARVGFLPGSYILGFSGSSGNVLGFEVRIEDLRDNSRLWNRAIYYRNITGLVPLAGTPAPVFYLPKPRLILEPGVLSVRLRNLDTAAANVVQFVIFGVQPCQP